jgi:hypothetical protein
MVERWGSDFYQKVLFAGGSVGCIFAIGSGLGLTPKELKEIYRSCAEKSARHGAVHFASIFMEECVRDMVKHPLAFKLLEGRLCVGTTYFFSRHRWHVSWIDNEDLVACVKRSCHIPFYCQRDSGLRGELVVDGAYGFAGLNLPHGDETLYIGIDPHAEVTRTLENHQMMYPVINNEFEEIVQSGYHAFMAWDGKMNKKVGFRQPNYQALYVLWTLKICEYTVQSIYTWSMYVMNFLMMLLISLLTMIMNVVVYILCGNEEKQHQHKQSKSHHYHHSTQHHHQQQHYLETNYAFLTNTASHDHSNQFK